MIVHSATVFWLTRLLIASACAAGLGISPLLSHRQTETYSAQEQFHAGWSTVVKQTERYSCGPALIAALVRASAHGITEKAVLSTADHTEAGISLAEFQRLLEAFGISGTWYTSDWQQLLNHRAPISAHFTGSVGHFVGIIHTDAASVLVNDPASGLIILSRAHFKRRWSGYFYGL